MGIKDKVKQWFLGPLYTQESLIPVHNREQFTHSLNLGCPVIFTMRDGYGLILFDKKEQLGIVYVKDVFGINEDYRRYFTLPDLISFFKDHVSGGISFYAWNS
ncbi:hypothetical protein AWM68_14850 [Fictibacillus phosphorivorans]|uniref:Uncharacterized protein n=1 Tax=Fictibacillus phosphorivorans TaxID=1221500 RepID=A0A161RSN0_9BACL|nr:hypothetical protein [Fictibacillus phosphorivorans]KZE64359.1 hypothetical protein AWM68_14850 [Fictibacillus phosphorivorans]